MTLLTITSVAPEAIAADSFALVVRFKDTEKQPISAANRIRAVVLPKTIWSEYKITSTTMSSDTANGLQLLLSDAIEELAKNYLSTIVRDSNWLRVEVPQEAFSLSSLLTWQSEQAAISGRLNAEVIKSFIASSVTIKAIAEKHGDKHAAALGEQFVKLAGPNHGLTSEKADKILSNLWKIEDADDSTGMRVMLRLQGIRDKQSSANLLDDLL